ncbi:TonB-dependent receptor plug domain-containing protein [Solimonas marina]|uniref:TonB-dependent receptor plug domain-containing protein n=1 Tax=Solimonas marina TaxID=2714601 RepID=UPI00344CC628
MLSLVSLAAAQFAHAQEVASPSDTPSANTEAAAGGAGIEEVVVTGTRIVRDGYNAPTPVTVMGTEQLQSFASPNIADAINTMPELSGSATPATSVTTASSGASNINALNLRALGTNRTLVLVDGRRAVASSMSGLVDINLIPQDLVKSVEVVTGGASAAYGSDALSGIVNFVLDKDFTGTKLTAQTGSTTYGDGDNWMGGLTYGTAFGAGRGHFLFNANYRNQDAIPINDRDWNLKGWQFMNNPNYTATNGQPRRLLLDQVAPSTGFAGGVITDTAFRGTAFGVGGSPYQIEYGDLVSDPDMHGGDWKLTQVRGTRAGSSLLGGSKTASFFARGSWDLTEDVNIFAQASYSRDRNHNYAFSLEDTGSITLSVDNAFLPESIREAMIAQGVSTFHYGSMHTDLPIVDATNDREVASLLVGAQGKFGGTWTWSTSYQHDISEFKSVAKGMYYNPYLDLAYDSVIDPDTGAAVCRSTLTDPTNGCKPYNPFGIGVNTQGAIDYVTGNGTTMWRKQQMTQDVAAFTVNGTPFATWAGDVSIATGVEWRMEAIGKGRNDELSPTQDWWVGGYQVSKGSYNVKEAFLEAVVPLAKDLPALKALDLSGAFRETDYSTSGSVQTWKLGLNWTPVDDVRFRTTLSRDIRAPNLEELFSNGGGGAPAIENPWRSNETEYITSPRIGNSELTPEKADSFGGGVVLTPRFLPGFALSIDYWRIDIDDAIGLPATQDIIDGCYEGQTTFCSAIDFADDGSQSIDVVRRVPFNYTTLKARGIDYEASYRFRPSAIIAAIPGVVQIRALATNYQKMASNIDGVVDDTAGQNTSYGPPSWKWNASINYAVSAFRGSVMARGISSGVYDNDWIECSTNCPTSTTKQVTVSDNHIPSSIFWDASVTYTLPFTDADVESFVNVRNVFDRDPPIVAPNPGGYNYTMPSSNAQLYDVLGRTFTIGLRAKF